MILTAGWASDVGLVREHNEDSYLVDDHLSIFAVADGVGGHRGGEVASSTAVEALRSSIANGTPIDAAIRAANTAVYDRSMRDPELFGMGTTMTVAMPLDDDQLLLGHVGDSRAYLYRGGTLTQVTDDHSMVGELVREGQITEEQAAMHPRRNVITRAIGMEPTVSIDLVTVRVRHGDRLLLCSDGITDMVHDSAILETLRDAESPQAAAESLADQALGNGGIDNLTAVVIDVADDDTSNEPITVQPVDAVTRTVAEASEAHAAPTEPAPARTSTIPPEIAPKAPRSGWRRFRWLFLSIVPLLAVVAIAFGALKYLNEQHWFVGTSPDGHVALFRGAPDAPFGWEPHLEASDTSVRVADIEEQDIREGILADKYCSTTDEARARECYAQVTKSVQTTPTTALTTTTTAPVPTSSSKPRTTAAP